MSEPQEQEQQDSRLFVRPLAMSVRTADVEDLFSAYGELADVKLMRGYGFVEFKNAEDANKAMAGLHGREFEGDQLVVEISKKRRPREDRPPREPREPRLKATHRLRVQNLAQGVSWQDLKDFVRQADVQVAFTDVSRSGDGTGIVDFASQEEMDKVVTELNDRDFKGSNVKFEVDPEGPPEFAPRRERPRFDNRGGRFGRDRYDDRGGYGRDRGYDRRDGGRDRYDDRGGYGRDRRDDRGGRYDRYPRDRDSRDGGRDGGRDRYYDRYNRRDRYDRDRSRSPNRYEGSPRYDRNRSDSPKRQGRDGDDNVRVPDSPPNGAGEEPSW